MKPGQDLSPIQRDVLAGLSDTEGFSITNLSDAMKQWPRHRIENALQALRRKGLVVCTHGYLGWSWHRTEPPDEPSEVPTVTSNPTLFDQVPDAPAPRARKTDPETSRAAARNAKGSAATGRAIALATLQRFPNGLTDFELADITGWQQTSIGVRRGDLVKLGLVCATDLKRPTPTGSMATVWKVVTP